MKKTRFLFKKLRIVLVLSSKAPEKAGTFVVERSNSRGVWSKVDRIGHYSLSRGDRSVFFDSGRLGFWLNRGASINGSALSLLADFVKGQSSSVEWKKLL